MEGERYHMTAESMLPHVDENTIGVVAILGSTIGSYEPVAEIVRAARATRRARAQAAGSARGAAQRASSPATSIRPTSISRGPRPWLTRRPGVAWRRALCPRGRRMAFEPSSSLVSIAGLDADKEGLIRITFGPETPPTAQAAR